MLGKIRSVGYGWLKWQDMIWYFLNLQLLSSNLEPGFSFTVGHAAPRVKVVTSNVSTRDVTPVNLFFSSKTDSGKPIFLDG